MNRIEEIKERLNKFKAAQGYANQRTPMLVEHRRKLLIDFEQNNISDMEYLVSKFEIAEKVFEEMTQFECDHRSDAATLCRMADKALEQLRS